MNNLSKILWDSCLGAPPRAVVAGCLESLVIMYEIPEGDRHEWIEFLGLLLEQENNHVR